MPFDKMRYPDNWQAISKRIRTERAENRCECRGQCGARHEGRTTRPGRCDAPNGEYICRGHDDPSRYVLADTLSPTHDGQYSDYRMAIKVMLTTAHLNHTPSDCREENLLAMCQYCHLRYDALEHKQLSLFEGDV